MWTLVDPLHKGFLSQKVQFYTLLRMVSIGQFQMQRGQPVAVDFNVLQQFQRTQLSYPWFSNLAQQQQQQQQQMQQLQMDFVQQPLQPVVNSSTPLVPLVPLVTQPITQSTSIVTAAPTITEDDDEEFGDFEESKLDTTMQGGSGKDEDDVFGKFGAATAPKQQVQDDLGDFGAAAPAPAPSPAPVLMTQSDPMSLLPSPGKLLKAEAEPEDGFGDFSAPTTNGASGNDVSVEIEEPPKIVPSNPLPTSLQFDATSFSLSTSAPKISEIKAKAISTPPRPTTTGFSTTPGLPDPINTNAMAMVDNTASASKLSVFDALADADLATQNEDFGDFGDHDTEKVHEKVVPGGGDDEDFGEFGGSMSAPGLCGEAIRFALGSKNGEAAAEQHSC